MKSRAIFGLMTFCNFSMKHCSIYPRRKLFDLYKEITPWLSQGVLFLLTTMAFNYATAINNLESFHALSSWSFTEWLVTMKHTGDSFVQSWDKDPMVISPFKISLFGTQRSHLLTEHSGATPFLHHKNLVVTRTELSYGIDWFYWLQKYSLQSKICESCHCSYLHIRCSVALAEIGI